MAKYSKIYENRIEKHELLFRGKTFNFSMLPFPTKYGTRSDKDQFSAQIAQEYHDISVEELEDSGIDDLWCEDDEEEIFDILEAVNALENRD